MMMRPPGMHTLASSPTKRALSGMCSPLSMLHTRSNELSSNGCCRASATWKLALSPRPCSFARALPLAACTEDQHHAAELVQDAAGMHQNAQYREALDKVTMEDA